MVISDSDYKNALNIINRYERQRAISGGFILGCSGAGGIGRTTTSFDYKLTHASTRIVSTTYHSNSFFIGTEKTEGDQERKDRLSKSFISKYQPLKIGMIQKAKVKPIKRKYLTFLK